MKLNAVLIVLALVVAFTFTPIPCRAEMNDVLMIAVSAGDLNKTKELIEKGADVNAPDSGTGVTPLILASLRGHIEIVKLLLDNGADISATSKRGVTAVMAAGLDPANREIEELLSRKASTRRLSDAAARGAIEEVVALIDQGADVNSGFPRTGITPLMRAAMNGDLKTVELLLDKGAEVNAKSVLGFTALMAASMDSSNTPVAELLLRRGADPTVKSASGKTALDYSSLLNDMRAPVMRQSVRLDIRDPNSGSPAPATVFMGGSRTKTPETPENAMTILLREGLNGRD